jgi:hypothetical protein
MHYIHLNINSNTSKFDKSKQISTTEFIKYNKDNPNNSLEFLKNITHQ